MDRLRENPCTVDAHIRIDVKQRVVILGGEVASALAMRVAGDDAWDIPGVVDVSNQLRSRQSQPSGGTAGGGATRPDLDHRDEDGRPCDQTADHR